MPNQSGNYEGYVSVPVLGKKQITNQYILFKDFDFMKRMESYYSAWSWLNKMDVSTASLANLKQFVKQYKR